MHPSCEAPDCESSEPRIDRKPVGCFREVEEATNTKREVRLKLLREGKAVDVVVDTVERNGHKKDRLIGWAGAVCTDVPVEVILLSCIEVPTALLLAGDEAKTS